MDAIEWCLGGSDQIVSHIGPHGDDRVERTHDPSQGHCANRFSQRGGHAIVRKKTGARMRRYRRHTQLPPQEHRDQVVVVGSSVNESDLLISCDSHQRSPDVPNIAPEGLGLGDRRPIPVDVVGLFADCLQPWSEILWPFEYTDHDVPKGAIRHRIEETEEHLLLPSHLVVREQMQDRGKVFRAWHGGQSITEVIW